MPWQLDTPINTGDLDPANDYDQIQLTNFSHDSIASRMLTRWEYGNTIEGEWVRGMDPVGKVIEHAIEGAEYQSMVVNSIPKVSLTDPGQPTCYVEVDVGGTPVWVERTYVAVKRALYEHLAGLGLIGAGSIC